MTTNKTNPDQDTLEHSNTLKDPDERKTGDEPMTEAQRSNLDRLANEAGKQVEEKFTKAEAPKKNDELQQKTGHGLDKQGR